MSDVVHLRLIDGTQVIGRFRDCIDGEITIDYPMQIGMSDMDLGMQGLILYKYQTFSATSTENSITFDRSHIIMRSIVHNEVAKFYYNSVQHSIEYVEEQSFERMREVNKSMEWVLSESNTDFNKVARKIGAVLGPVTLQ